MIQALNDFVIIKREDAQAEAKTSSGIFLQKEEGEVSNIGIVVSVGSLCKTLKAGDKLFLPFFAKDEIEYEGKNYCYLHEKDLPAKLQ